MQESVIVEQFNRDLLRKLKVLYDKYTSLKSSLSKLPKDSIEAKKISSEYSEVIKEYNRFSDSYQVTSKFTKLDQIEKYQNQIQNERNKLLAEYEELKVKYNEAVKNKASIAELNKIALRATEILKINSFYNELLLMMDKPLSLKSQIISVDVVKRKVREVPKSETSKEKTVISSVEKPVLQTKTAKKNYASDPDILALHTMNRKIQGLKDMYYKMDSKSQEAKKLKIVIYKLCAEREEMITKLLGYEAANKIVMVESMEDATFSKEDTPLEKPFELKSSTFSSEFTTLVYMLGDLEFSGLDSETFKKYRALEDKSLQKAEKKNLLTLNQSYKKCYDTLIKKYHNILRTIVGKDDKLVSMGQDLLGTLRLFNINGGYASFKAKHKDGKIGSEAISKEMYKEGIDRIKTLLNAINVYGTRIIERNGGIITVNDTEKTREQRIAEINTKYFEIYDMILQARKQTVVSNL